MMGSARILFLVLLRVTLCGSQTAVPPVTRSVDAPASDTSEETTEAPLVLFTRLRTVTPPSEEPEDSPGVAPGGNLTDGAPSANTTLAATSGDDPGATGRRTTQAEQNPPLGPDGTTTSDTTRSPPASRHPSDTSTATEATEGHQTRAFDGPTEAETGGTTVSPRRDSNKKRLGYLILAIMALLALLLIVMVVMLVRKKRRSGSRNFSKRSRRADGQNAWAGQAPELAEGGAAAGNGGLENGTAVAMAAMEQEMTTFGEKKGDSVEETGEPEEGEKETAGGKRASGASEEKKPLLEEDSDGAKEEQFPLPPPEQGVTGNGGETH